MEKQTHLLFLVLLFSFSAIISTGALAKNGYGRRAHHHHHGHRHRHGAVKLFVFGDSYADTGNSAKSSSAWNGPYGITFPGKSGGRYSDGRVLTDYVEVLACEGRHGHPHHDHHHHNCHGSVKLFVFGDSYADTGNSPINSSHAWGQPYGITFPGKAVGRYSDGRVLTDYIASFFGIRSPLPFRWRKFVRSDKLGSGMNFAYGGSGVFETWMPTVPNMTTQIDYFQQLLEEKIYTKKDLDSSIALVSLAGNDYITFVFTNGSLEYMPDFSESIVKQLVINLKRIHSLGIRKVLVVGLEPIGCLPAEYETSDKTCSKTWNDFSKYHNSILKRAVYKLNRLSNESCPHKSVFRILDLYKAFMSAFKQKHQDGCLKFEKPFESCCLGLNGSSCGDVDEKGVKQYSVCEDPESAFFWDLLHPTQSGWHAIYSALKPSLYPLL